MIIRSMLLQLAVIFRLTTCMSDEPDIPVAALTFPVIIHACSDASPDWVYFGGHRQK